MPAELPAVDMTLVELEVQRATSLVSVPADEQFQTWVEAALTGKARHCTLAIHIVDVEEAQRLNCDYRAKDYATNVLSFPVELPQGLPAELVRSQLGDLLLCAPVIAREAREQNRSEASHWAHLTIHGVLHLLGYEHKHPGKAHVMEGLETEILAKLGFPDPYQNGLV